MCFNINFFVSLQGSKEFLKYTNIIIVKSELFFFVLYIYKGCPTIPWTSSFSQLSAIRKISHRRDMPLLLHLSFLENKYVIINDVHFLFKKREAVPVAQWVSSFAQ